MQVLHGTWIPNEKKGFVRGGAFYLWLETAIPVQVSESDRGRHPNHLPQDQLLQFLTEKLGIKLPATSESAISSRYFLLPTSKNRASSQPIPSPELAYYLEQETPETCEWQYWEIDCYYPMTAIKLDSQRSAHVLNVIKLLSELHFIAQHQLADVQLGSDLLFWFHFTQFLKSIIFQDQYIPSLKLRLSQSATLKELQSHEFEIYAGWEIVSATYEAELDRYAEWMPTICTAGFNSLPDGIQLHDPKTLLKHFSEVLLTEIVTHSPTTATYEKQIAATVVGDCLHSAHPGRDAAALKLYQQWKLWRDRIAGSQEQPNFLLYFQLHSPDKPEDPWTLEFQVASRVNPSLRIPLIDYWRLQSSQQDALQQQFGDQFERYLLMHLGYAARMYPKLWAGLENAQPTDVILTVEEALEFLTEAAWILKMRATKSSFQLGGRRKDGDAPKFG